eukprot:TRINITY_DN4518_c0_g1_i9.p1 TRINITY_DN4518_c0_g1~~TRINITY_DN4518_c0_g1_i9.p1  ORF type:complete len:258 (-),score=78.03 TRINITY_DN4518_c0_g1_i9:298-963(-)
MRHQSRDSVSARGGENVTINIDGCESGASQLHLQCTTQGDLTDQHPAKKVAKVSPSPQPAQPESAKHVKKSQSMHTLTNKDMERLLEYIEGGGGVGGTSGGGNNSPGSPACLKKCRKSASFRQTTPAANAVVANEKKRQKKERQKLQRRQQILETKQATLDFEEIDSIFAPKSGILDEPSLDEEDRELEEFKQFCYNSVPRQNRTKINFDMKDIMSFSRKN